MPLESRLQEIGAELRRWQVLWQEHAFRSPRLGWEREWPDLSGWLRALPAGECARLQTDEVACDRALGRWLPVPRWRRLAACEPARAHPLAAWPRGFARDVPGRKWRQVEALAAALEPTPGLGVVDWCAGKGHLARALAAQWGSADVVALEREPALAADATQLARRQGLAVRAVVCDVMTPQADDWILPSSHVIALHACGHLHLRLLRAVVERRTQGLSLAPCCYHLGGDASCMPQSCAGAVHWPGFRAVDLRTAVQETVTAGASVRRRRQRLQQWQLGFDLLARELRGTDAYQPLPAVATALLGGSFADFCRELAARMQLALPGACDFAAWERAGAARYAEVNALDLVRQRFRRLIELWLVLDRALLLQEHGYRVSLATFCERSLSPRNLLLQARLAA